MGLDDIAADVEPVEDDLEQRVRNKIREAGFKTRKVDAEGISGNYWELDAVAYAEDDTPVAYFEVKEPSEDSANQTYTNHMTRAAAKLADFRNEEAQGAVVVPEKWKFGNKDWDAMFESINCRLLEEDDLDEFLREL